MAEESKRKRSQRDGSSFDPKFRSKHRFFSNTL
jgi:hypothetical protein